MLSVMGVRGNWRPSSGLVTKKLTILSVMMLGPSFLTVMVTRSVTRPLVHDTVMLGPGAIIHHWTIIPAPAAK